MLFDLQSRGRKSAIKVIYTGLAVLMGSGLVLFGVGGAVSGGLLDAFNNDKGSNTSSVYNKRIASAEKIVAARPTDASEWALLTRLRFQKVSSEQLATDGEFTDKGKKALSGVDQAWTRYLALNPPKPDVSIAQLMIQTYGPGGLAKYDKAVSAMEVVLAGRPASTGLYVQYATLAYLAGQNRKGDLAATKAEDLAPKDLKAQVKSQLDSAKQQAAQLAVQQAQQQTG